MAAPFFSPCWAAPVANVTHSKSDVVEQAENLSLHGQRLEASALLIDALHHESVKSKKWQKLKTSLDELATVFYGEKAQQLFEFAQSLYFSGKEGAIQHYREALSVEPHNVTILVALMRALVAANRCSDAKDLIATAKKIDPYFEDLTTLSFKSWLCASESGALTQQFFPLNKAFFHHDPAIRHVDVGQYFLNQNKPAKAKIHFEKALSLDKQFPEAYYWLWRLTPATSTTGKSKFARNYLQRCKNMTSKVRRTYKNEPQLCQSQDPVEKFLQGLHQNDDN